MVQKVVVRTTSDLSGSPEAQTVRFGYEGYDYQIDLTEAEHGQLGAFLSTYLTQGRRVGRSGGPGRRPAARAGGAVVDSNAVRTWARANGYEVSSRGRIPASIQEAYRNSL
jgi:hypothetical protein